MASGRTEIKGPLQRVQPVFEEMYRGMPGIPQDHLAALRLADFYAQRHSGEKVSLSTETGVMRHRLTDLSIIAGLFAKGFREYPGNPQELIRKYKQAIISYHGGESVPFSGDLLDIDGSGFAIHDIEDRFMRLYTIVASANNNNGASKSFFLGFQETVTQGFTKPHQHVGDEEDNGLGGGIELYVPLEIRNGTRITLNRASLRLTTNLGDIVAVLPGDQHSVGFFEGGGTMLLVGGSGFGPKDYRHLHKAGFKGISRRY